MNLLVILGPTASGKTHLAVQAARLGFLAIAPAVRGLSVDGVPEIAPLDVTEDLGNQRLGLNTSDDP